MSLGPFREELWKSLSYVTYPHETLNQSDLAKASEIYRKILKGADFEALVDDYDPFFLRRVFRVVKSDSDIIGKALFDNNSITQYTEIEKLTPALGKDLHVMKDMIYVTKIQQRKTNGMLLEAGSFATSLMSEVRMCSEAVSKGTAPISIFDETIRKLLGSYRETLNRINGLRDIPA